jgi:hypothetical protein
MSEVVLDSSNWQNTINEYSIYDEDDQSYTNKIGPTNTTGDGYNNFEFSLDYINVDDDAYGRSKALMYREAETCCSPGFPLEQQEDALQEKQRQREANDFGATAIKERHVPTANEHTRMNVKERRFEKKLLAHEWTSMEEEDKRSKAVEQVFRTEALKQNAEAENAANRRIG